MQLKINVKTSDKANTAKVLSDSVNYDSDNANDSLEAFLARIAKTVKDNVTQFESIA
jgi:hypothetical protein